MTWLIKSIGDKFSIGVMFLKNQRRHGKHWRRYTPTSKIFLVLLIYIRSYFHYSRMVALYLAATLSWRRSQWVRLYQPLVLNLNVLQRYYNELAAVKFLSGLDTSLGNQVRRQILGGDIVSPLSTTLSRVHHLFGRWFFLWCFFWCWELCDIVGGYRKGRGFGRGCGLGRTWMRR